ncbi:MAG: rod shape-determining protein [Sulfurospirillaceae bacterium]|nr:rod shape-determining protein [Sulfurospirillaceae bacterium]MDD3463190.1 rod shape-determining protein [Sulfurospirillaceae bacterium]
MFSFIGFRKKCFAIDLGTNNTLVYQPDNGIIFDEPTSISFDVKKRSFSEFGISSKIMFGKSPKNIHVINPLSKGAISNLSGTKEYIKKLIPKISHRSLLIKPEITISVPCDLTHIERQAVLEAAKDGGASEVFLIKDPFSAAIGSLKDISTSEGIMILDIGAGVSEITLLSYNGIVATSSIRSGGNDMDEAIVEYFKSEKRVLLSLGDAEIIKKNISNITESKEEKFHVSVKNLITNMPQTFEISSNDAKKAILPIVEKIAYLAHGFISKMPPNFANTIYDNGIFITGGASILQGLDTYLQKKLNISAHKVENPLKNIILGAGKIIENKKFRDFLNK